MNSYLTKNCVSLFPLNKSAGNDGIRGDLGRFPIVIDAIRLAMKYWEILHFFHLWKISETSAQNQYLQDLLILAAKNENYDEKLRIILDFYKEDLLLRGS